MVAPKCVGSAREDNSRHFVSKGSTVLFGPAKCNRRGQTLSVRCDASQDKSGDVATGRSTRPVTVSLEKLRADLNEAIAQEDYEAAARLRDELRESENRAEAAVLDVNRRFYDAFQSCDREAMGTLWDKQGEVHCIHPAAMCIAGYDEVMSSWEMVFSAGANSLAISLDDVQVNVAGDMAYVTCIEVVRSTNGSKGRLMGTNIFKRRPEGWFMVLHHASQIRSF
eukprot:jgi/Mesvir1/10514/Mv21762-RA.1